VAALVDGVGHAAAVAAGLDTARALGSEEVAAAIAAGRELDPAGLAESGDLPFPGQASGYVLDSLTLAVAAVGDPRPLAAVLADIARLGHDADTNAAIAGGLRELRDGAAAIPARWTAVLQVRRRVRCGRTRAGRAPGRLAPYAGPTGRDDSVAGNAAAVDRARPGVRLGAGNEYGLLPGA